MEWNYVAVLYVNDTYGKGAFQEFKNVAKLESICIAFSSAIGLGDHGELNPSEISRDIDRIIRNPESPIIGTIIFGSSTIARSVLLSVQSLAQQLSFDMTFIFSEGVDLDSNTFHDHGQIMDFAKGAYIVSPQFITVKNFSLHWKDIFRNQIYLSKETGSNPWLEETFKTFHSCDISLDISKCIPTTEGMQRAIYESKYTGYVIQSVLALAKIIKDVHNETCHDGGVCEELLSILRDNKGELIKRASMMTLDYRHEFQDLDIDEELEFRMATDVKRIHNHEDYAVHKLQTCQNDQDSLCIKKVSKFYALLY